MSGNNRRSDTAQQRLERGLLEVRQALENLRFGTVTLTIHDGQVVQIDISERHRL